VILIAWIKENPVNQKPALPSYNIRRKNVVTCRESTVTMSRPFYRLYMKKWAISKENFHCQLSMLIYKYKYLNQSSAMVTGKSSK